MHKGGRPQNVIAVRAGCALSKHTHERLTGREKCGRKRWASRGDQSQERMVKQIEATWASTTPQQGHRVGESMPCCTKIVFCSCKRSSNKVFFLSFFKNSSYGIFSYFEPSSRIKEKRL